MTNRVETQDTDAGGFVGQPVGVEEVLDPLTVALREYTRKFAESAGVVETDFFVAVKEVLNGVGDILQVALRPDGDQTKLTELRHLSVTVAQDLSAVVTIAAELSRGDLTGGELLGDTIPGDYKAYSDVTHINNFKKLARDYFDGFDAVVRQHDPAANYPTPPPSSS